LPLAFEANTGQTAPDVKFLARGRGYTIFVTSTETVVVVAAPSPGGPKGQWAGAPGEATVLRMRWLGADPAAALVGVDPLPGRSHYFLGADKAAWRRDVATWGRVRQNAVYPGIDLVHYGNQRRLEYDFVVAPGADPGAIALALEGSTALRLDAAGDLVVTTPGGIKRLSKGGLIGGISRIARFFLTRRQTSRCNGILETSHLPRHVNLCLLERFGLGHRCASQRRAHKRAGKETAPENSTNRTGGCV
jgi:hypothetical protein